MFFSIICFKLDSVFSYYNASLNNLVDIVTDNQLIVEAYEKKLINLLVDSKLECTFATRL